MPSTPYMQEHSPVPQPLQAQLQHTPQLQAAVCPKAFMPNDNAVPE